MSSAPTLDAKLLLQFDFRPERGSPPPVVTEPIGSLREAVARWLDQAL